MSASDLNPLLHRSESETLDFKRQQYPFAGATDEQKGELLKDIISIANAFKDSDGFILIGVEEEHGRAKRVCGADATLADSDVQQFVKSKTNRPVSFLVEVVAYKGMNVTVIKIDKVQERPIFLGKNFGRLKGNVVYIRRGSSTGEATLDEIADMGREESVTSREAEKKLAKKEKEDRFWRDFRIFLPKLEQKVFHLKSTTDSYISDAIYQYRLPLDNAKDFLRQAGELDLDAELRDKLSKIVDGIHEIDEYMNLGSEKFKEWYCNTRNTMQNLYIWVLEMRRQYAQSEPK